MIIKFQRPLSEFDFILSFDVAKFLTGWSLINFKTFEIIEAGIIDMSSVKDECIWPKYYTEMTKVISFCSFYHPEIAGKFFVTKEKMPLQAGHFSTISTLQALAQAHAICDMAMYNEGVPVYDYEGVHSVSVKALFKKLTGVEKPTKLDIKKYIEDNFKGVDISQFTQDVSDSIAVSYTLVMVKWNNDIKEEIKNFKKEQKKYKTKQKQNEIEERIEQFKALMI